MNFMLNREKAPIMVFWNGWGENRRKVKQLSVGAQREVFEERG